MSMMTWSAQSEGNETDPPNVRLQDPTPIFGENLERGLEPFSIPSPLCTPQDPSPTAQITAAIPLGQ